MMPIIGAATRSFHLYIHSINVAEMTTTAGRQVLLIMAFIALCACEHPFSYSIYDADVPEKYRGTTCKNLSKLAEIVAPPSGTFKIAVLTDVHYNYDNLTTAIDLINRRDDITFVVVAGDITHQGLLPEYLLFMNIMKALDKPWFTLIGNHDYLSNGKLIYSQMFGQSNYSIVFGGAKFVFFDDVFWESDTEPDFDWLGTQLADYTSYRLVVPFAHIPPANAQFTPEYSSRYHQLMVAHGIALSVHGHVHSYYQSEAFGDGVVYLIAPAPNKKAYAEIVISDSTVTAHQVLY